MGGANPSSDSGSADAPTTKRSKVTKYRGEGGIVDFIKKGGVTGAVIRGVSKKIGEVKEQNRRNKLTSSFDSEEGIKPTPYARDNDNDNSILSTNTAATKQVASSGIVTNTGIVAPTTAEVSQATSTMMSDAEVSVANKKKGRSTTILNRATGLGNSNLNTTKKTLGA